MKADLVGYGTSKIEKLILDFVEKDDVTDEGKEDF